MCHPYHDTILVTVSRLQVVGHILKVWHRALWAVSDVVTFCLRLASCLMFLLCISFQAGYDSVTGNIETALSNNCQASLCFTECMKYFQAFMWTEKICGLGLSVYLYLCRK